MAHNNVVIAEIISLFRHKVCSSREKDLLTPLGELVEVNGHKMSVYTEGDGDKTLVFMSGAIGKSYQLHTITATKKYKYSNPTAVVVKTTKKKTVSKVTVKKKKSVLLEACISEFSRFVQPL